MRMPGIYLPSYQDILRAEDREPGLELIIESSRRAPGIKPHTGTWDHGSRWPGRGIAKNVLLDPTAGRSTWAA